MRAGALVIGIGNIDRGDDAAGLATARHIEGLRTREVSDCSSLVELWDGEIEVVVVDAMISGTEPGTIRRFDATAVPLPTSAFSSTHSFDLAAAIELSKTLGKLPTSLTVYGIEAGAFEHGEAMTPAVEEAAITVAAEIQGRLT